MIVIRSEADIKNLSPGDDYMVILPELLEDPEGPIKLLETKEWAEAERLHELAAQVGVKTEEDDDTRELPPVASIVVGLDPKDKEYVLITSAKDLKAKAGGDIRDGAISLKAGVNRRKLQKNDRQGWISLDGERYAYA